MARPVPIWGQDFAQTKLALFFAAEAMASMIYDANWQTQAVLLWISQSPNPWPIDSEMGDLAQDTLGSQPLIHYLRYDAPLDKD